MRRLALLTTVALLASAGAAHAQDPAPPAVTTGAAQSVDRTAATLTATIDPNGAATTYRFQYGTSTSYGLVTAEATVPAGDAPVPVSVRITGLTEDTPYHYRVTATNAAGTVNSADRTLRTDAPLRAPAVSTRPATSIRAAGATLVASVNPRGQATTVVFQYGTSSRYGAQTAAVSAGAGTGTVTVRANIRGLQANTGYQYRAVATNATGTTRGGNRSFVTLRAPRAVSMQVAPRAVRWNGSVTVRGRVSGSGVARVPVALERSDFPYLTGYREAARRDADAGGAYSFTLGPLFSATRVRVVTRTTIVAASRPYQIANRVAPGLRVTRAGRTAVALAGSIDPAVPSGRVSVQRRAPSGRWVRIRSVRPQPLAANRSRYRVRVKRIRRTAVVRVVVVPNDRGEHANGVSREIRIARRR
jgi:hypothetical protein